MTALSNNLHDEATREQIEALQWTVCQQLLTKGLTAIVEWGSWAGGKETSCASARELGAAVELHYLSVPVDVLFDRIERRAMEDPPITREMVTRWSGIIEVSDT